MKIARFLDILGAALGLLLLAPVLLLVTASVLAAMGRPVLFAQVRPGLHGRRFRMYKFRTMTETRDELGRLLPDHLRLRRLGRFLRSTSLDELPQLFNVLKGDMSLVGPRPLLVKYLHCYTQRQARRHEVRPGITGWAQINGRNAISWDSKLEMDVWYVENRSLALYLRILAGTAVKVLRREGISADNEATMPEFSGSAQHGQLEHPPAPQSAPSTGLAPNILGQSI